MLFVHVIILLILLGYLFLTLSNLVVYRGLKKARHPLDAPLISVLVPARNEALNIEACVGSLLEQEYPNYELIVLDDSSTDGTGEIVRKLFAEKSTRAVRTILLPGTPLPEGWTGKGWACHQLSKAATGDYLFFTDADTTHAPGLLSAALMFSRKHYADLMSAWPQLITRTLGEKLIIPIIALMGFAMFSHVILVILQRWPDLAEKLGPRFCRIWGAANGQFMFFTRKAYERIGGHEAVRAHVVEDVALGREVAQRMGEGMRLINCESMQFSTVRMYRSFRESWDGFTKNIRAAFDRQNVLFWLFMLTMLLVWLFPCFAWIGLSRELQMLVFAEIVLIYLIRFLVTARFRLSWIGALLHPVGIALMIGIGFSSWRLSHGKGVMWKGRTYKPEV